MEPGGELTGEVSRPCSPLPRPLTVLIGRDDAVPAIAGLLDRHRLVSLVGPAGCGKTRLSIAVADRLESAMPGGAHLIDLTDTQASTVDDLAGSVVDALRLRRRPDTDPLTLLVTALAHPDTLVLFDNCEHLIGPSAALIAHLLAGAPALKLLVTSRQPLRVEGEAVWLVRPLPVPQEDGGPAEIAGSAAVRLFRERVAAHTGRPMADADLPAAGSLCRALDGLPLAIELAAARAPILSVPQIDRMLNDRFRVLANAKLMGPPHHRTLRGALDWSYRLLSTDERSMLRRLSVCRGGWTADAAAALWPGGPAAADALVAGLVDKSLVVSEVHTGQTRYRLLQSVAAYAAEGLAIHPHEVIASRTAHGVHHLALAEHAETGLRGPDQRDWLRTLLAEHDNLRAAMSWLSERPQGADDLRLASALSGFHHLTGDYAEGRRWLADALARRPDAPALDRVRANASAATLAMLQCDYGAAAGYAARGLDGVRDLPDRPEYGRLLCLLGSVERERGNYDAAMTHLTQALAHFKALDDPWGTGRAAQLAGGAAWLRGDLDTATVLFGESLDAFRDLADDDSYASTQTFLGGVAHYRGDRVAARTQLTAALERFTALDFPEGIGWALNLLGLVDLGDGRTEDAARRLRSSLDIHTRLGDRWRGASVLEALAEVARLTDAPERAAALLGAASAERTAIGTPVPGVERASWERTVAVVRELLGDAAYEREFARGAAREDERALTLPVMPEVQR